MEIKRKREFYSVILLVLIYLLFVSIPFPMFIKNEDVCFTLNVSMRVLFIPFFFVYVKKENLLSLNKPEFKLIDFKYLPFIILTVSNFIVSIVSRFSLNETISTMDILKSLILSIFIAFNEELVFRVVIIKEMIVGLNRFKTILFSSIVFGLIHLVNIGSFASIPYVLLQVLYSFGMGLVLALIFTNTYNFIYVFIIHFLFDFLNGDLVEILYEFENNYLFFILNIAIAVLLGIYGILVYVKEEKNVSKTMDI